MPTGTDRLLIPSNLHKFPLSCSLPCYLSDGISLVTRRVRVCIRPHPSFCSRYTRIMAPHKNARGAREERGDASVFFPSNACGGILGKPRMESVWQSGYSC